MYIQTDRHTNMQTNATKNITMPLRGCIKINNKQETNYMKCVHVVTLNP